MIQHIVTFIWNERTTPADVAGIEQRLAQVPQHVPELVAYTFGRDLGISEGNGDFAVIATLQSVADLPAYRDQPFHAEVARDMRAMAESRTAVQIDTGVQPGGLDAAT